MGTKHISNDGPHTIYVGGKMIAPGEGRDIDERDLPPELRDAPVVMVEPEPSLDDELAALLKDSGIADYSIYLDEPRGVLFAVLRRRADHAMDTLPQHPVMQRWWQHMKDIMRSHPDGSPVAEPLPCMFHLD